VPFPFTPNCRLNIWEGNNPAGALSWRLPEYANVPARQLRPFLPITDSQYGHTTPNNFYYRYLVQVDFIAKLWYNAISFPCLYIEVIGATTPTRFVQIVVSTNIVMEHPSPLYYYILAAGSGQLYPP